MNIHAVYSVFNKGFRQRRVRQLRAILPEIDDPSTSILDLGGTADWWKNARLGTASISIANLDARIAPTVQSAGFDFRIADGRSLPFA